MAIANLAAAGILLLTAFFVFTTLRADLQQQTLSSPAAVHQEKTPDSEWQPAKASGSGEEYKPEVPSPTWSKEPSPTVLPASETPTLTHESPDPAFAYVFYATSDNYACSALVNIHRLRHVLHSQHAVHVLLSTDVSDAYVSAFREANVQVHVERVPVLASAAGGYYQDCLLKLLAFKLHRLSPGLKRVLAFDADQLLMRNLDDLFTGLPQVDLAAPRAYWLAKDFLASTFMMIGLSDRLWDSVRNAFSAAGNEKFDMDLINDLLGDEVLMLGGEYVVLNSHWEDWNLPKWHHPKTTLNMTTVDRLNDLAKQARIGPPGKRQADHTSHTFDIATTPTFRTKQEPETTTQTSSASVGLAAPPTRPAKPRFPEHHPIYKELAQLEKEAAIIHFSALGKPWTVTDDSLRIQRPDAHPLLGQQFRAWRSTAAAVCPGTMPGLPDPIVANT